MTAGPSLTERFSELAQNYDAVLSDVWGVIHNGIEAFPEPCDALIRFRAQGGRVALITNAPRPGAVIVKLLDRLKVPREAYDAIVSSGDVTRAAMAERPGKAVFHIGPERDLPIFDGLGLTFVPWQEADYVVCTGLSDDETETPSSYRELLTDLQARGMFMLCGNPDLVVERGNSLVYCAGALADLYASLGGEVLYAGKPHRPIYDRALQSVAGAGGKLPQLSRVLAIGDSVRTDLKGASDYGIDCLFVTGGIHAEELGDRHAPDLSAVGRMFDAAGLAPRAITRRLAW